MMTPQLLKIQGCILGGMCGDVLGASVEGASHDRIQTLYPNGLTEFPRFGPRKYGAYTDDSQMTLALMKSLICMKGVCDVADCARSYANDFQVHRGYGETALKIMVDLKGGADPYTIANKYIKEGSWANGGAMRISPVGLLCSLQDLRAAVTNALHCTHTHPHAIDGAFIQAAAVGYLLQCTPEIFNPVQFLEYLEIIASVTEFKHKLQCIRRHVVSIRGGVHVREWSSHLSRSEWTHEIILRNTIAERFQIKAIDAVSCALLAFCCHWREPHNAVIAAVHYGGDTDTIAAMTGNLAFTLHGIKAIPTKWLDNVENRTEALELCEQFARIRGEKKTN